MSQTLTPALAEAIKHIGVAEVGSTNSSPVIDGWTKALVNSPIVPAWLRNQPWCGTFVASCLKKSGMTKSPSEAITQGNQYPHHWYRAAAYKSEPKRLKKPAYGCVAVKARSGGNHVFFVVGITPQGKLVGLGGNQSNKVCYALFEQKDLEFFWYGKTNTPLTERYNLPIIKNVTASNLAES